MQHVCYCCELHCYVGINEVADLFVLRTKSVNAVGGWIKKQKLIIGLRKRFANAPENCGSVNA